MSRSCARRPNGSETGKVGFRPRRLLTSSAGWRREEPASSLDTFPERGARVREVIAEDLRQIMVGRYRLVYRVEAAAVGVVRLLHSARDFRRG